MVLCLKLRVPNRTRKISSLDEKERFIEGVGAFLHVVRYSGYGCLPHPIFRGRFSTPPTDGGCHGKAWAKASFVRTARRGTVSRDHVRGGASYATRGTALAS